jgi:hypothetical protein
VSCAMPVSRMDSASARAAFANALANWHLALAPLKSV